MPRKAASIEYLERLVAWSGNRTKFCAHTHITPGNLSAYLNGQVAISWKRLKRCNEQIFGASPAFIPVLEGYDLKIKGWPKRSDLPDDSGIYGFFDSARRAVYYGKATDLYAEVKQSLKREVKAVKPFAGGRDLKYANITAYISAYKIKGGDSDFRHDVEVLCHKLFVNNTYNKNSGDFKRKL